MNSQVIPVIGHCESFGKLLSGFRFRESFYHRPFLTLEADLETQFRTYFYSVAICHQTNRLFSAKRNLSGWDYIEAVFCELASSGSALLKPGKIAGMQPARLQQTLASLFSDDGDPKNTTLDDLVRRASFLTEADQLLGVQFKGRLQCFFEATKNRLLNNGSGIYDLLPLFVAYSDPFKKKITFLVKLMSEAGLLMIQDPENLVPIMDYHMQRVLLRTGCVKVCNTNLADSLRLRKLLHDDTAIRGACIEACRIIAAVSGIAVVRLNDIFWSIGRSCCHEKLRCQTGKCEKQPCTFEEFIEFPIHGHCALETLCKGKHDETYRSFWQPVVETHYY